MARIGPVRRLLSRGNSPREGTYPGDGVRPFEMGMQKKTGSDRA